MHHHTSLSRFVAWSVVVLFFGYQYILRISQDLMPYLTAHFQATGQMLGQYSTTYYLGYAAAHIPLGLALDHFGVRRVLPTCILMVLLGLLPLIFADMWWLVILGRFFVGAGSCGAILSVFKVTHIYFPDSQFSRLVGCAIFVGILSATQGGAFSVNMAEAFGWLNVLICLLGSGALLAVLSFLILPAQRIKPSMAHPSVRSLGEELKILFTSRSLLWLCVMGGLMIGPLEGFADMWGAAFLEKAYHIDIHDARALSRLVLWGYAVGGPVLTWIGDRTRAYMGITTLAGALMGGIFTLILLGWLPTVLIGPALFFIGFFCAYQVFIVFKASTRLPERPLGLSTATANMIMMAFGSLFHTYIGGVVGGSTALTLEGLTRGLWIIPVASLVAVVGLVCWKEKKAS